MTEAYIEGFAKTAAAFGVNPRTLMRGSGVLGRVLRYIRSNPVDSAIIAAIPTVAAGCLYGGHLMRKNQPDVAAKLDETMPLLYNPFTPSGM